MNKQNKAGLDTKRKSKKTTADILKEILIGIITMAVIVVVLTALVVIALEDGIFIAITLAALVVLAIKYSTTI